MTGTLTIENPEPRSERRLACLKMTWELFEMVLGMPGDCRVISAAHDPTTDCIVLHVQSERFEALPEGSLLPVLTPAISKTTYDCGHQVASWDWNYKGHQIGECVEEDSK